MDKFAGRGETALSGQDEHMLLVTHNFQIGWFAREALAAPQWRWLGLSSRTAR